MESCTPDATAWSRILPRRGDGRSTTHGSSPSGSVWIGQTIDVALERGLQEAGLHLSGIVQAGPHGKRWRWSSCWSTPRWRR